MKSRLSQIFTASLLIFVNNTCLAFSGTSSPLLKCDRYYSYGRVVEATGVIVRQLPDGTMDAEGHIIGKNNPSIFWVVEMNGKGFDGVFNAVLPNADTKNFSIFNGYYDVDYINCMKISP